MGGPGPPMNLEEDMREMMVGQKDAVQAGALPTTRPSRAPVSGRPAAAESTGAVAFLAEPDSTPVRRGGGLGSWVFRLFRKPPAAGHLAGHPPRPDGDAGPVPADRQFHLRRPHGRG